MHNVVTKIIALIKGEALIEYVDKTLISKTPDDVTQVGHN